MHPTRDQPPSSGAPRGDDELTITLRTHSEGVDLYFNDGTSDESWTTLPWDQVRNDLKRSLRLIWNSSGAGRPAPEILQTLGALMYRALHGAVDRARDAHIGPDNLRDLNLEIEGINNRNSSHAYLKAVLTNIHHNDDLEALRDLERLADEAIEAGDNRRALELVQNVMTHYRNHGDDLGVARCTIRGAELMMDGGSYHKTAHTWLTKGLSTYRSIDPTEELSARSALWRARAGLGIARLLILDERNEEALAQCNTSLEEARDAPSTIRGALLLERAEIASRLDTADVARSSLQSALSLLRSSAATDMLARAHEKLGEHLAQDGDQLGAQVHLDAALKLARQNNDLQHVISLSLKLSLLAEEHNEPEQAWEVVHRALPYAGNQPTPETHHTLTLRLLDLGRDHNISRERLQPVLERSKRSLSAAHTWEVQAELMTRLLPIVQRLGALDQLDELLHKLALLDALRPSPDETPHPLLVALTEQVHLTAQWLERRERYQLARRAFKHVVTGSEQTRAHATALEARCGVGRCETALREHQSAEGTFDQALDQATALELDPISVYEGRARLRRQSGRLDAARADLLEVLNAHRQRDVPAQIGQTLIQIGALELDRAEAAFSEQLLDQPGKAFQLEARGEVLLGSETLRQALSNAERCLGEAWSIRDGALARQSPLYLTSMGRIHLFHGDTEEARRAFEDALELSQSTMPSSAVVSICLLAEVLAYDRLIQEAFHASNTARQMVSTLGGPFEQVLYLRTAGRVMYILGDKTQAHQLLGRFVAAVRTLGDPHMESLSRLEANLIKSISTP